MNINRYNYEEFFLLYADGELSAGERKLVDQFIQSNPDLKGELDILKEAYLQPEELVFEAKNTLYKSEQGISLADYEENFLLYIDDELSVSDKEKVETFVLQHPQLQDDFTLLKQTKLEPVAIICPDKASLYKTETRKPVVYMRWMRVAVAAAIIGIGVSVWVFNTPDVITTSTIASSKQPLQQNSLIDKPFVQQEQIVNQDQVLPQTENRINKSLNKSTEQSNNQVLAANSAVNNLTKIEQKPAVIKETPVDNHVAVVEDSYTDVPVYKNTDVQSRSTVSIMDVAYEPEKINKLTAEPSSSIMQQASYKEIDTDIPEKNTVLVGGFEIRKDKISNFFQKARNIFRNNK